MASAVVNALSMAVGKAAGNGSVSSFARISDALQAHTLVSTLGAGAWLMAKPLGLLVLLANLYLFWVHLVRHNRVKAIKKKYGYTKDPRSYQDMTMDIAQEVEKNLAEWDMPWLFELGWLFNFLATATVPVLSATIIKSGHFTNPDPMIAQQRQEDTVILMSSMMAHPLRSRSSSLVLARINEHHNYHGPLINSDTVLYLIWLFGWGPVEMLEKFGWRKLQPFERHGMWIFWRELALRLGCKYVPETLDEMISWKDAYIKQEVRPHADNKVFADAMKDMFLYKVPVFARSFAFQCILALVDDDVAMAVCWDGLKEDYHQTLRYWIFRLLRLRAFVHRHLTLPRRYPYVRTTYSKNELGLYNFEATTYSTSPFYVKATFRSRWGLGALINRIRGFAVPGPMYFSDGVAWESMGARRNNKVKQQEAETKVVAQAKTLENAGYGFRARVNFQPEPLVKGLSLGYGDRINAYPAA